MRSIFAVAAVLLVMPAAAQQFAPITIDAAKYAEIDAAFAKLSMPREAHAAWLSLWQNLEMEARRAEAAAKAPPHQEPPK